MEVSLYQAAAAMNATAQWQELIAENLTTASISGGRKRDISFSDVQAGLDSGLSSAGQSGYSIPTANAVTNFQPGEMHASSNPMDFALEGPGFFTVQLPDGEKAYTRGGEFHVDANGQLSNDQGFAVLGSAGPVRFNPNSTDPVTIAPSGEVSQGQTQVGKLQVTEFNNPKLLEMIGADDFRSDSLQVQPQPATSTKVRQGFLEGANASPTTEMSSLVTAMREFEANQKVMQMQSERMSQTINELGGTS
jgi:flagellar basal-body rod protein FlgF